MEEKNNLTTIDYSNRHANIKNIMHVGNHFKKTDIKKYNTKSKAIIPKKIESKITSIINDSKKKSKHIKSSILDTKKPREQKERNLIKKHVQKISDKEIEEKQNISKSINKSELKENKYDNKTKNIKVNKIKIEKINLENAINVNSITNRDFYRKTSRKINDFDLVVEEPNTINKYTSDFYNSKKSNLLSVKSFNKTNIDNEILNKDAHNSEFINFMNPYNKNISLYDNTKNNNRYSLSTNTYSNNTTNGKSKISYSSKILINFKNIKTFYAHLEIFISLSLKRSFKYFIEKIKNYEKPKNNIQNIEINKNNSSEDNNYRPIVNVNNAHCSLYCSINLNQDKLINTIFDNRNICFTNNTFTPITKNNEIGNIKQLSKGSINNNNNNKKNRLLLISPEYDINLSKNKKIENNTINNHSVYVPKKKISKSNTDFIKGIKSNNNKKTNIKSSPIKEMNINLKQINVCRLNDLNHMYLTQNLYQNNTHNFNYSEITPYIKINNNNLSNHVKYSSNNIFSINNNSNNNIKDKNKLKKIQSAKNGIYIKPKDKNNKKKIKEIKIKNKLSPVKKDINNSRKENNIKSENLLTTYSSFNKIKYLNQHSRINSNLYTINSNKDENPIKKIYIKRSSQNKNSNNINLKNNLFDSYKKQFYSTFLNFKSNKNNIIDNEILIKQITTLDKRVFINIKYINNGNNNYIKKKKNNILNILNLKNNHVCSVSIINNKMELNKETYKNMLLNKINHNLKMQDIYSFDNDKKRKFKSKNISFSFKEYSPSKEESFEFINDSLINYINSFKNIIITNIRKYFFNKLKKIKYLKKLLNNKKNKIINLYLKKWKYNLNNKQIKVDLNNCKVYHKINYNDDFNLNKRLKTPKNIQKYENSNINFKAYNMATHNSINQFKSKNKLTEKKNLKDFSSNKKFKGTKKFMIKEINIVVHNNTKNNNINNNIALTKLKNNFFLMRIKLIKNALKMIKNTL